ncbi:hypothetical protein C0991_002651, partial [Blastosporella zonata]
SSQNVPALGAWVIMWMLCSNNIIVPDGICPTILGEIKLHYIDDLALWDITNHVKLGAEGNPVILGPIPRNLVTEAMYLHPQLSNRDGAPPSNPAPGNFIIPPYTRRTRASASVINWLA